MVSGVRLKNLQLEIQPQKVDAVLISRVANITYLTGYSGFSTEEREAFLLITPQQQLIFTDGRYSEAVKKLLPDFRLVEIGGGKKFKDLLKEETGNLKITKLGIEEDDLKVSEFKQIKKVIRFLKDFKFHQQRSLKTDAEVSLIEKACEIGDLAFKFILTKIKAGISEKELAYYLENFIRVQGFESSFKTIIAFGENSAVPHHQTGEARLKSGDFVLMDFGVRFKNYCSDMTRTVVFGRASQKQKKIYQTVKESQEKAAEFLKKKIQHPAPGVGVLAKDVDRTARQYILGQGFPSIPHSLGHGIGIEVHEHPYLSPNSQETLKEGMVFSIEPGIYIPGFGGVRIEDLYVLESNGIRQLTDSPKEFIEI
ncbi:MAG TPA: Xaa-Pro peptidase family protein [Patescibacteria group bacterium]|nr:Xaa-Pro peptidase family protein [Patescibacteria group bacterium]